MKNITRYTISVLVLILTGACGDTLPREPDRMEWWRDARFGLFIHWGLYSIPAGQWEGETNHEVWIRESAQIPLETYDSLVSKFNPVKFDAGRWVSMAKNAGMKYIVITSKHHDGFALFDSQETDFDIMSTPFKRDILKELADACAKEGIRLCFYYSILDWHHPDYLPRREWETSRPVAEADFDKYVSYMKNQLDELVTNYGKIGVLWFDGEWESTWTHEKGKEVYQYLRKLQPDLIINNRVDKGRRDNAGMTADSTFCGDFGTPEQEIPPKGLPGVDWESCITMNNSWAYTKADQNWKSSEDLVRKLVDIASKGGNFLLNVGPTAEGLFPDSSVRRLEDIGRWLKVNGAAIYETEATPFDTLAWGRCTQKKDGDKTLLYLHVFNWPDGGQLRIPGLKNEILRAYALNDPQREKLSFSFTEADAVIDLDRAMPSDYVTVIALEIEGSPIVAMQRVH